MVNTLGLDCGASSSKWCVQGADGLTRARGVLAPVSGLDLLGARREQALATLRTLAAEVKPYRIGALWAGVTGLDRASPQAAEIAAALAAGLDLDPARLHVESDLDLAYRAHFAPGAGVLVYAGTGAIGYHLDAAVRVLRAGGHGPLLDDEGGGFFIGRTALRALLEHTDRTGRPASGPLAALLYARMGGSDWPLVRAYVYGGGREALAALAPLVGQAAGQGDEIALEVLGTAGRALAALAQSLLGRLGALPVVLAGGALRVHERIAQSCAEALPGVALETRDTPHEEAAAWLARALQWGA